MKLAKLFTKDITRNIDGVIQVEKIDVATIHHELEEYVVTKELDKHLRSFFDILRESDGTKTNDIGIWISGFFGSGKSHFLKMLAYLIENKDLEGKYPIDFFQDKIKDNLFFADMKSIVSKYTTDVLLFNIDSKANATSKSDKDAIVEVCMKVFFTHLGFFASKSWLAHQEWKLWKNGEYDLFKKNYQDIAGHSREEGRIDIDLEKKYAIQALMVTKGSAVGEEEAGRCFDGPYQTKSYQLSPESFREIVTEYCDMKGKKHRIMFMIDEVGQYIGSNPELMLNLQTVTEELRMLGGKAWMIVTSQEAIDKVTHMDNKGHYDFSKIKGRFKTQISLSSTNVDEVLKKRLLEKTSDAKKELGKIYEKQEHSIKNMLTFDPDIENSHYKTDQDFVEFYPLVPYQIELTKQSLHQIGNVGYAGNHLARGERSSLAIFQEAIKQIKDCELGALIPFDVVYDAIVGFIPSYIKGIFYKAEEDSKLDKIYDIRILKILFLLKSVKDVPLTPDNITTLMINSIDTNVVTLKEIITKSLHRLQTAGYINKRTDDYEFLSDEEQEIENEIRRIDIEDNEVYDFIYGYFFDDQFNGKFAYDKSHDYACKKIVDTYEKVRGSDILSIQIRTPWYVSPQEIGSLFGSHAVSIHLDCDTEDEQNNPMRCIQQCLRIQKYIMRHTRSGSEKRIDQKALEAQRYKIKAKELLAKAASTGTCAIGNNIHSVPGTVFKDTCQNLLKIAFENIYTEFKTLPVDLHSNQIEDILRSRDLQSKLLDDASTLSGAHKRILTELETTQIKKTVTTLAKLHDTFTQAPYGWKENDINKLVAQLWIMKNINIKFESKEVQYDDPHCIEYLTKAHFKDQITLEVKQMIDPLYVNKVAEILRKVDSQDKGLNTSLKTNDADQIKIALFVRGRNRQDQINRILTNYKHKPYPGESSLEAFDLWLSSLKGYESSKELFDRILEEQETIIGLSSEALQVQDFFAGKQKDLRDEGYETLQVGKIINLLSPESLEAYNQLKVIVDNPIPYNDIRQIAGLKKTIDSSYQGLLKDKKKSLIKQIDEYQSNTLIDFKKSLGDKWDIIINRIQEKKEILENSNNYADLVVEENQLYSFFEALMQEIESSKEKVGKDKQGTIAPRIKSVKLSSLIGSTKLSSDKDIDKFVDTLKKMLNDQLKDQDSITLLP